MFMIKGSFAYIILLICAQILFLYSCSDDQELEVQIHKQNAKIEHNDRSLTLKEKLLLELILC